MSIAREKTPVITETISFVIREDSTSPNGLMKTNTNTSGQSGNVNATDGAGSDEFIPLMTSKMANVGHMQVALKSPSDEHNENLNSTPKEPKSENSADLKGLIAQLQEQQRLIAHQREALERKDHELIQVKNEVRPDRNAYTLAPPYGAIETHNPAFYNEISADPKDSGYTASIKAQEVQEFKRLQAELKAAQSKINAMNEELIQSRITKHTIDQALSQSGDDHSGLDEVSEHTLATLQTKFAQLPRPSAHRADTWPTPGGYDESSGSSVDYRDSAPAGPFVNSSAIWSTKSNGASMSLASPNDVQFAAAPRRPTVEPPELYGQPRSVWNTPGHRSFSGQPLAGVQDNRFLQRRASYNPGAMPFTSGLDRTSPTAAFTPSPVGTPLGGPPGGGMISPAQANIWAPTVGMQGNIQTNLQAVAQQGQNYVSAIEPLNYRRLLERSVNCNWKYIVDKIVCNNDQQASIFLQQKLKIGTVEQKHAIVDAIVAQAYQLMINRFGNFLVQRCFEHGNQEQIQGIANAIRGNTVVLSMDAFGCHVIQKAFDCVPEDFKATMVSELLRRIPETVIHRYACHVWQKLFELRWVGNPPQIMKYVNEALRGMWHEVALGETGSLVVQNIFENCLEADKRPCINEVLEYIDLIAHGQFGNWCIQHICEHGAPLDRTRATDVVIQNAAEYSMDQYASKVVEKCLKIGGNEFLDRYLDRVCEGRPDRPRIPLIDIASDQYGNYLVQWILQHASMQHREQVASHIRKHMVSLRGSKFGSRVGMLCCNPIYNRQAHGPPSPNSRFARFGFR